MYLPRTCILISKIHHPCSIDGSRDRQLHRSLQTAPSTWNSSRNKLHPTYFQRIHSRIELVLLGVKALQAQRGCYQRVHYHTLPPILETRRYFRDVYLFTTRTGWEKKLTHISHVSKLGWDGTMYRIFFKAECIFNIQVWQHD
jgi:hypothetical protein